MKNEKLIVCIDANVYISAVAFGGIPSRIIQHALSRSFYLITSSTILDEVHRNLVKKLEISEPKVQQFLEDILRIATIYEPQGKIEYIKHKKDNLVLETALLGDADILVTGDKKDLLPLKVFNGIIIEPPSAFLLRIESI